MSSTDTPSAPPPGHGPPPRSGWLTALMVMAGIILLLPGLCALAVGVVSINDPMVATFLPLILLCLLIGFGGIMLLRAAFRGRPR